MTETSLGLTLMILVTIAGQEISHLVSPWAALGTLGIAIAGVLRAYKRA